MHLASPVLKATDLTVIPLIAQIVLPLTADMAKPEKRAQALAITLSGLTLGVLVARVLSGTITNYSSWRNVYWMAVGLQAGTSNPFLAPIKCNETDLVSFLQSPGSRYTSPCQTFRQRPKGFRISRW